MSDVHISNSASGSAVSPAPSVTVSSDVQSLNAEAPILVTESGTVNVRSDVQFQNAEAPMVCSAFPASPPSVRAPRAARPMATPAWGIRARPRKLRTFGPFPAS